MMDDKVSAELALQAKKISILDIVKRVYEFEGQVEGWKRITEKEREDKKALLEMMQKA